MVKPEWGAKRTCPKCGTRFYDLGKTDPVTCINCGVAWEPEPILKSKQPLPFDAPKPVKKPEEPEDSDLAEVIPGEDEDADVAADDDDLGGDEDLGVAKRDDDEES